MGLTNPCDYRALAQTEWLAAGTRAQRRGEPVHGLVLRIRQQDLQQALESLLVRVLDLAGLARLAA